MCCGKETVKGAFSEVSALQGTGEPAVGGCSDPDIPVPAGPGSALAPHAHSIQSFVPCCPSTPLLCTPLLSDSLGPKCELSVLLYFTIHAVFATQTLASVRIFATQTPLPLQLMPALDRENSSAISVVSQTPTTDSCIFFSSGHLQARHNITNLSKGSESPSALCCCCSISKSCPTLYNFIDCSTPGLPCLPEFAQIHVH